MSAPAAGSALLVLQCFPTISASVAGGPQPRRLAEGGSGEGGRTEAAEASVSDASSFSAIAGSTASPVFALAKSSEAGSDVSGSPSSIGLGPSSSVAASSPSPPPAEDSPPSTSQGRDRRMAQHPFLRVPFLEAGVGTRNFQRFAGTTIVGDRYIGLLLRHLRNLLRMPSLGHEHANAIVNFAERLASHARRSVVGPLPKVRPRLLVERIARRFLVFYLLHMASKAVQQNWPEQRWWRELAAAIPTDAPATMSEATVRPPGWPMLALARRLAAAASVYKRGGSLRDEELVALMVDLFGPQGSPGRLRDSVWGPWRLDAHHESSSS
ncbi:hypothetical protein Efla_006131 [Eimeria flavescens]